MGQKAKDFKLVLIDEPTISCRFRNGKLSIENVIRVLDTVTHYCPNLENLEILPNEVDDFTIYQLQVIETRLLHVPDQLSNFNLKSFLRNAPRNCTKRKASILNT